MLTELNDQIDVQIAPAVLGLLEASQQGEYFERRSQIRHPFFAPVSLRPDGAATTQLSAFSRDISFEGIGLLHNYSLERGERFEIHLRMLAQELRHLAEVDWCSAAGEGWYLSGWRFIRRQS